MHPLQQLSDCHCSPHAHSPCPCVLPCVVQDCRGGHCLQQHLHKAMHHCGGKLHGTSALAQQQGPKAGLHGSLELPGLSDKQHLELQLPGVRLFALELAALQASAQQQLDRLKQQSAEQLDKVGLHACTHA